MEVSAQPETNTHRRTNVMSHIPYYGEEEPKQEQKGPQDAE
jgi:hypothetical protein